VGKDRFSYPAYENLRDENEVFEGVLARYRTSLTLERAGATERVMGELVSGNYFQVLGVSAELGRVLGPDDDQTKNGHPVAVLSHRYWRDRFGADPSIVGGTVRLNGHPMTVLGVARRGFHGVDVGRALDVFVPLSMKPLMTPTWDHLDNRRTNFLHVFARLREGISLGEAEASVNVLYRSVLERDLGAMPDPGERFEKEYRAKPLYFRPGVRGISELRDEYQTALIVLHGMLGLVLVIVCANVANLLVARSAGRRKEIAIHLALGASRFALARRLWVESLVLALAGGLLGLVFSSWTAHVLVAALPVDGTTQVFTTEPDMRVLGFALVLSVFTGLVFGLVPAREPSRTSLASTLKDERAPGGRKARLGEALVIAQVALALLLLMDAGLFGRSLYNLRQVDVGFETENLLSFSIDPSLNGYSQDGMQTLLRELSRELGSLPGVTWVSVAEVSNFTDDRWIQTIRVQGYKDAEFEDVNVDMNAVGAGYFRTMGIPLLRGRDIAETDRAGGPKVAVINETM
ncbi:MAG: ABC transporter permease, partial [Vicinamibacteria bacterium]